MQTTYMQKRAEVERQWHLIDAKDQVLGRVASEVAQLLIGKHKPTYTPHIDGGDYVVVINAGAVRVTGAKETDKTYYRHSGFPGGLKKMSFQKLRMLFPTRPLTKAVYNMIPKNRLRSDRMARLKVYAGPEHPHAGQINK